MTTTESPIRPLEHELDALLARIEAEMTQINRDWQASEIKNESPVATRPGDGPQERGELPARQSHLRP